MNTTRRPRPLLALIIVAILAAATLAAAAGVAVTAHAATRAPAESTGARMLDWAEAHAAGHLYQFGGTGPASFDCSGTIWAAAKALGVDLPRTSYAMAAGSVHLTVIPVSQARRGDILVWPGAGHVMFDTIWPGVAFGALDSSALIGWHPFGGSWSPVSALRVH